MEYLMSQKRLNALDQVDKMPAELREVVHEFGLPIVTVLVKFGIKKPNHIREVVRELWGGGRQEGQKSGARNTIDFALSRNLVSYEGLVRLLADNSLAIVPKHPTRAMIAASMETVSGYNLKITKAEKHKRRLEAAIEASMKEF